MQSGPGRQPPQERQARRAGANSPFLFFSFALAGMSHGPWARRRLAGVFFRTRFARWPAGRRRTRDSFAEPAIERLAEAGALPSGFAARFGAVAGFRNVFVHGYLEVDIALGARCLAERLEDFEEFACHVERWIEESPGS